MNKTVKNRNTFLRTAVLASTIAACGLTGCSSLNDARFFDTQQAKMTVSNRFKDDMGRAAEDITTVRDYFQGTTDASPYAKYIASNAKSQAIMDAYMKSDPSDPDYREKFMAARVVFNQDIAPDPERKSASKAIDDLGQIGAKSIAKVLLAQVPDGEFVVEANGRLALYDYSSKKMTRVADDMADVDAYLSGASTTSDNAGDPLRDQAVRAMVDIGSINALPVFDAELRLAFVGGQYPNLKFNDDAVSAWHRHLRE